MHILKVCSDLYFGQEEEVDNQVPGTSPWRITKIWIYGHRSSANWTEHFPDTLQTEENIGSDKKPH